jgi:hypothetical protein
MTRNWGGEMRGLEPLNHGIYRRYMPGVGFLGRKVAKDYSTGLKM